MDEIIRLTREEKVCIIVKMHDFAEGGADPKSPVGTAASFSKANKYALKLANTSLFFEFATNELLNSVNG